MAAVRRVGPADVEACRGVARAVLDALLDFAREAGGVGRVWLRASEMGRPVSLRAGFAPRDSCLQRWLDG